MEFHWADIYAQVYKAESSPTQIAEQEGVSISTVTAVIRGTKTSHPVAYAISSLINISTEKLWPGRYLQSPAEYKKLRGENQRGRLPSQPVEQLREAS